MKLKKTTNYYIVYRYNKKTKEISSRKFTNFDKKIHNSDKETYYYFNFNLENGLLENPYSYHNDPEVNKICKKVNMFRLFQEIYVLCSNEVFLVNDEKKEIIKLINSSVTIYNNKKQEILNKYERNKKEFIRERYETNKAAITDRLSKRFKISGQISNILE